MILRLQSSTFKRGSEATPVVAIVLRKHSKYCCGATFALLDCSTALRKCLQQVWLSGWRRRTRPWSGGMTPHSSGFSCRSRESGAGACFFSRCCCRDASPEGQGHDVRQRIPPARPNAGDWCLPRASSFSRRP